MTKCLYRDASKFEADAPLKIDDIQILWKDDDSQPDWLGEFSNQPGRWAIDREALGERQHHELQYFNPANFDPDHPEHAMEDMRRYETLGMDWYLEGCVAKATVSYPIGNGNRRLEHFSSGGLWGIESDSDENFKLGTEIEQLEDLKKHVKVFGVPWSDKEEAILVSANLKLQVLKDSSSKTHSVNTD